MDFLTEQNRSTPVLLAMDKIFDTEIDLIQKTNSVNIDVFKEVYMTKSVIMRLHGIKNLPNYKDLLLKIEDPVLETNFHYAETFSGAYRLSVTLTMSGYKRRIKAKGLLFIWYLLAVSKNLTLDTLNRIFNELKSNIFKSPSRMYMVDNDEIINEAKRVLSLNQNLSDEIKLWLALV